MIFKFQKSLETVKEKNITSGFNKIFWIGSFRMRVKVTFVNPLIKDII